MATVDLNSDLGENSADQQVSDDHAMLGIVSSANVACGFHAGDPHGIATTLSAAATNGVAVGAHPGYPDRANFGREPMDLHSARLQAEIEYQLGALMALASAAGTSVRYVKPHGALYNTIARHARQADDVIAAIRAVNPSLVVLGLAGSVFVDRARNAGLKVAQEAFADRAYNADGSLVSRKLPGAVLHDPRQVAERMVRMVTESRVTAIDGTELTMQADSICVHGDSAGAVEMARSTKELLKAHGVTIAPFVS